MVREFQEEKSTMGDGDQLIISTEPILIKLELVESCKEMGEGRSKIVMASGREYILKCSYSQMSNSITIANNNNL